MGTVTLGLNLLCLDFPKDRDQIAEVKRIPGARWDPRSRLWTVPVAQVHAVREFAARHGFDIDPEVLRLNVPKKRPADVTIDGDVIRIRFDYDPVLVNRVKAIQGAKWDPATKTWTTSKASAVEALAFAEASRLQVHPDLKGLAASIAEQRDMLAAASRAVEDVEIDLPVETPFPLKRNQRLALDYIAKIRAAGRPGVLIGASPGLGKSGLSLLALEREQAFPAVVVCPATLKLNWQREAQMWLPHRSVEVVTGRDPYPVIADIVIVNYDILAPAPKRGTTPEKGATGVTFGRGGKISAGEAWCKEFAGFKGVVFDESTAIKEFTAARTKGALHIVKHLAPNALRLALTGTPLKNRTSEFAAQLDAIGALKDFGGAWGFYKGACGAYQDNWGHWVKDGNPSEKRLRELNDKLRTLGYIRQTKEEFLDDLAPVEHQVQWVDGDPKIMREYAKAEADLIAYLVERARQIAEELGENVRSAAVSARMKAEAAEHLVRLSTLRQIAARAKLEAANEFIQERLEADLQVVVAAHHRDVVDALAINDVKIQGGMKPEEIEDHKARFQAGEHKVISLSIQAAGMGHTLTAAQDVLFVELPWSPADVEQTYSRCHRIGQQGSVTATYLLIPNTIDEEIWDLLQSKQATITAAVEGTKKQKATSTADVLAKYLQKGLQ